MSPDDQVASPAKRSRHNAPATLTAAVALAAAQVTSGIVVALVTDTYEVGGRVLLAGGVALGYLFAWNAWHLRAGGVFGLLMLQATSVLVAAAATEWPAGGRAGLAVAAVVISALLFASLHAFPSPTLPTR